MRIVAWWFSASVTLASAIGCDSDVPIGQACTLNPVPCDSQGLNCGFRANEVWVNKDAKDCESKACIVYHMDNGTNGELLADPQRVCDASGQPDGCVTPAQVAASMYCSCRCAINGEQTHDTCLCERGFACETIGGLNESYCIKEANLQ